MFYILTKPYLHSALAKVLSALKELNSFNIGGAFDIVTDLMLYKRLGVSLKPSEALLLFFYISSLLTLIGLN